MRWRMLGWICLAELGALSLWFSATAVIPALHTSWMSTAARAWLSMAVTVGFVVGTVTSAVLTLADYVGARRLFVLSAVGGAAVNAALLLGIDSLPVVLTCRFLTGLAMAGTYPPGMKLAASWFVRDRGLAVGSLVGALTLGIVICNDSNYFEPARLMAAQGATALFVPTNNGLPPTRARAELVAQARAVDIARAVENSMWVIRADVAGRTDELVSYGSSGIVDPDGMVVQSARQLSDDLIVAEIDTVPRARRRGWEASPNRAVRDEDATHVAASVTAART